MRVKSESEVAQSCLTLRDPMDYSPPGSSVHGVFQARVLEWDAIAFSDIYIYIYTHTHTNTYTDIDTYEGLTGAIMKAEKALKLQ